MDLDEIKAGYTKYYGHEITEDQVEEIFNRIDIDGNGYIEYTEFVSAAMG